MYQPLSADAVAYTKNTFDELYSLLIALCTIPAPSNQEGKRAQFVLDWFAQFGGKVTIDAAQNAILEFNCENSDRLTVITAHTDTVFADTTPFEPRQIGDLLYCPGVGDDTANVAVMMMAARYLLQNNLIPRDGLVIAANAGEEGLGNLSGIRQIMQTYSGRVARHISLDGTYAGICNKAVGSHRYRVTVTTKGGHSYSSFGNRNAIQALSTVINALYEVKLPHKGKNTFNVGTIEGGTSVNSIAQHACMLYEYRSDERESLEYMQQFFMDTIKRLQSAEANITVELLGERPCMGDVDSNAMENLVRYATKLITGVCGEVPTVHSGSTDCNIPFAMGIPAVCFGAYLGQDAHTREESLSVLSLQKGYALVMTLLNDLV